MHLQATETRHRKFFRIRRRTPHWMQQCGTHDHLCSDRWRLWYHEKNSKIAFNIYTNWLLPPVHTVLYNCRVLLLYYGLLSEINLDHDDDDNDISRHRSSACSQDKALVIIITHLFTYALQSIMSDSVLQMNAYYGQRCARVSTLSVKKTSHYTFVCNFAKCWPIFKILSLTDSVVNLR